MSASSRRIEEKRGTGDTQIERVVLEELAHLKSPDLGKFEQLLLSPLRRSAITSPLLQLPPDEAIYAFNLVRFELSHCL
jgi:cytokinin dehydrogenase